MSVRDELARLKKERRQRECEELASSEVLEKVAKKEAVESRKRRLEGWNSNITSHLAELELTGVIGDLRELCDAEGLYYKKERSRRLFLIFFDYETEEVTPAEFLLGIQMGNCVVEWDAKRGVGFANASLEPWLQEEIGRLRRLKEESGYAQAGYKEAWLWENLTLPPVERVFACLRWDYHFKGSVKGYGYDDSGAMTHVYGPREISASIRLVDGQPSLLLERDQELMFTVRKQGCWDRDRIAKAIASCYHR